MIRSIVTLTTDFGLRDPYIAEMKAVILNLSSNVTILDISHGIDKFDIRMGAYVLASASSYFPAGTIHVAVVDPSVGSQRRSIMIETEQAFFIGPDNGILALACSKNTTRHIYEITNRKMMLPVVSGTFHGRDIFAPAAAYLANGVPSKEFGPEIHEIVRPEFANLIQKRKALQGEVIYVDDFGNIVTNFHKQDLNVRKTKGFIKINLGRETKELKFCRSYAEVEKQSPLVMIGSHGFLEIAVNEGNAAKKLGVKIGDSIAIQIPEI
jgi:S-adenosylmethionine hydrolase